MPLTRTSDVGGEVVGEMVGSPTAPKVITLTPGIKFEGVGLRV